MSIFRHPQCLTAAFYSGRGIQPFILPYRGIANHRFNTGMNWNHAQRDVAPDDPGHPIYAMHPQLVFDPNDPEDEPSNPDAERWIQRPTDYVEPPRPARQTAARQAGGAPTDPTAHTAKRHAVPATAAGRTNPRPPRAPSPDSDSDVDYSLMPELDDIDIVVMGIPIAMGSPVITRHNENEAVHNAEDQLRARVQDPSVRQQWPDVLPLAARVVNSAAYHGVTNQLYNAHVRRFHAVHNDSVGHCTADEAAIRLANVYRAWPPHEEMCLFLAEMVAACPFCIRETQLQT